MERIPKTGALYRDEEGRLYQLLTVAEHARTGEKMAVYQCLWDSCRVYADGLPLFLENMRPEGQLREEDQHRDEEQPGPESQLELQPGSQPEPQAESRKEEACREEAAQLNPLLLDFVEEEDYGKRLDIFRKIKGNITQQELDILYEILDLFHKSGDVAQQADAVESYLKMQKKFDGTRLR